MKIALKRPMAAVQLKEIQNTVEDIQAEVGGYFEMVRVSKNLIALVDEEGKMKGLPKNIFGLVGPIVFVGIRRGQFVSISDRAIAELEG